MMRKLFDLTGFLNFTLTSDTKEMMIMVGEFKTKTNEQLTFLFQLPDFCLLFIEYKQELKKRLID